MAEIPKVPEDQFKAVVRALLSTPPLPLADIPRKREPKLTDKRPKKKGLGDRIKQTPPAPSRAKGIPLGKPSSLKRQ